MCISNRVYFVKDQLEGTAMNHQIYYSEKIVKLVPGG